MSESTDDNIVIRCAGCKRVVYIAASEAVTEECVKEMGQILDENGPGIEHMTTEQFRKQSFGCKCE